MPLLKHSTETRETRPSFEVQKLSLAKRAPSAGSRFVVVHAGARDAYEVSLALAEAGLLERLVTDFFWCEDGVWARLLSRVMPNKVVSLLRKRSKSSLPRFRVSTRPWAGLRGLFLDKLQWLPFSLRQRLTRSADASLGRAAGRSARKTQAELLSYSYYAFDAFKAYGTGGILFQMHPHPATMRRILNEELALQPECASSLKQEWELALPEADFQRLCAEPGMASHILAASSFTRASLVEQGIPGEAISVVPYGIDLECFHPDLEKARSRTSTLQLLFVGRINQRKGLKYLLDALEILRGSNIKLTICGYVQHEQEIFRPFLPQIAFRPNLTRDQLVGAYQAADLFVLPSIAEGFGQVLLEALACGLPLLSTTHTAAPDLIEDGVQGFIVEPRRADLLAERISWAMTHRRELAAMGASASERAKRFTWQRFREDTVAAVRQHSASPQAKERQGVA